MVKQRSHSMIFMTGLMVFILLILAGVIAGIITVPVIALTAALEGPSWPVVVFAFGIGIYMLGWVFSRFSIKRR